MANRKCSHLLPGIGICQMAPIRCLCGRELRPEGIQFDGETLRLICDGNSCHAAILEIELAPNARQYLFRIRE